MIASWLGEVPAQALPAPTLTSLAPAPPPAATREGAPVAPSPALDSGGQRAHSRRCGAGADRGDQRGCVRRGLVVAAPRDQRSRERARRRRPRLGQRRLGRGPAARVVRAPQARSGLGWSAGLSGAGARDVVLGQGVSRWTRVALGVAPRLRWVLGGWRLDAEAGPAAALTIAWGRGYDLEERALALTWGVAGGLRLGHVWGPLGVWADARGFGWLGRQRVRSERSASLPATQPLPATDVQLAIGASYVFR